jgi:hypothetical protein
MTNNFLRQALLRIHLATALTFLAICLAVALSTPY